MTSSTIPSCPPSVLVLGAGELGIEIIKSLAQHPLRSSNAIDLAVLLRSSTITSDSAAKQAEIQAIKDLGFRVVAGDVVHDTREDLSRIFKDFHTVISCTGMTFPPGTQVKITKAVLEAGCARYFPWQFGVDYDVIGRESSQDLFTEQLNVRDLLRAQEATQWVIVSTGMFISFLFLPEFGIVNEAQTLVTAIGGWDNRLTVTSPADIGRITAALALQYTNEEGVVFLAGDTVSMGDLVEIIRSNSQGKEVMTELKTVEDLKAELVEDPENPMKKYRVVFGEGRGVSWEKEKTFNYRIGMEMETVKDWAAKSFK